MDKMREDFSKHCQLWRYSEEVDENDFFVNATTQRAWDVWAASWKASRQALVVEIPDMPYYEFSIYKLQDALNDAGVRYVWVESESD